MRLPLIMMLFVANLGWASTNSITWRSTDSGTVQTLHAVAFGGGIFVAGGDNTILTSSNGIAWTQQDPRLATGFSLRSITYGKGLFVGVAGVSNQVLTSPDGVVWTLRNSGSDDALKSVTYGDGLFVAVGWVTSALSLDGIKWIAFRSRTLSTPGFYGVAYGNRQFVAVGGELGPGLIASSSDGVIWTERSSTSVPKLRGIAFGNGQFVAIGDAILVSSDGTDWRITKPSGISPVGLGPLAITYVNNEFMAVAGDVIMATTNGITWALLGGRVANVTLRGIAFGHDKFVVVGDRGTISVSEPSIPPTPTRMGPLRVLPDGAVQGSVIGKAGQNYVIQTSMNLVDWLPLEVIPGTANSTILQFTDPSATNFTRRFYRSVSP